MSHYRHMLRLIFILITKLKLYYSIQHSIGLGWNYEVSLAQLTCTHNNRNDYCQIIIKNYKDLLKIL